MKIQAASMCALLLCVAPAVASAQYVERWSQSGWLGPVTSLVPGNLGNFDGDPGMEIVISSGLAQENHHVEIRDVMTGALEFSSATSSQDSGHWTIYVLDLDGDAPPEILAADGERVIVIDYMGALAAPTEDHQGLLELRPSQPNPFGERTSLAYTVPAAGKAEIEVFDVAGRMVRRLGGERVPAGAHELVWDGRDQAGRSLQPGMYLYRLNVDGRPTETQKTVRLGR